MPGSGVLTVAGLVVALALVGYPFVLMFRFRHRTMGQRGAGG